MILYAYAAVLLSSTSQPATPPDDPLAPIQEPHEAQTPPPPTLPAPPVMVVPRDWPGVFAAIRGGQWSAAAAGIQALPRSTLTPFARAQLYTAKGSPPVSAEQLQSLLAEAPELPQSEQLRRMALARGSISPPPLARRAALVPIGSTPRRGRASPVAGEPEVDRLRRALEPLVKVDDAAGAEALLLSSLPLISAEARAELGQRVAWIYYVRGEDAQARRMAELARAPYTPPPTPQPVTVQAPVLPGEVAILPPAPPPPPPASVTRAPTGPWAQQAEWVSGLASWRLNDCNTASRAFREVGQRSTEPTLAAAGYYWAARAEMACRRPASVQALLRAAARNPETFYGMLARRALGHETRLPALDVSAGSNIARLPNIARAEELVRIGERDQAGELLRHQARIGTPVEQPALVAVAARLQLPATQHFLGHFGQPGSRVPAAARYPAPPWVPREGWRIDPSLALAHALQESSFRAEAVSQAGAVGLMQVLPSTRDLIVRSRGLAPGDLKDPGVNMGFGQAWIEWMRGHPATGGQLPKIIASYNAGPLPVGRWQVNDRGDPLLWIESMPYWETRFYVPAVMRNLWVYQGFAGQPTVTLTELAQHRWPSFPVKR